MSKNRNRHQNVQAESKIEDQVSDQTNQESSNNEDTETKTEESETNNETETKTKTEKVEETKSESVEETKVEPTLNLQELMNQFKSKSAVMRHLHGTGWSRSKIAKFMDVRYQFVRNVLIQPIKTVEVKDKEVA